MLIKSREEQDEKKIVRHTSCGWCKRQLDYPRIVAADANHTSYHLQCALQFTTETIADIATLLTGQDLPELSQRIVVTNMLGHPGKEEGELSAMAQAFRAAARQGGQQASQ